MIEWGHWSDESRRDGEPTIREKKEWLRRRLFECDPARLRYIKLDDPRAPVMPVSGATRSD